MAGDLKWDPKMKHDVDLWLTLGGNALPLLVNQYNEKI